MSNLALSRRDLLVASAGLALGGLPRMTPALASPSARTFYRGDDLRFIGMPVGGILAGQVYLGGDGRLWLWDVFNEIKLGVVAKRVAYRGAELFADGGANYIEPPVQVHPFAQGFALRVDGQTRAFDATGWRDVAFCGEYPIGTVAYHDPACPVSATLEAFSPFLPLDAEDSGLPATILAYRVRNDAREPKTVEIAGWMENPVGLHTTMPGEAVRTNRAEGARILFGIEEPPRAHVEPRPPVEFEAWAGPTFEGWTATGDAFGSGPRPKDGARFAHSFFMGPGDTNVQGDARTGRLVSRDFTVARRYVEFAISGGNHPRTARIDLVVDGRTVRTATGRQTDLPRVEAWDVGEYEGRAAHLEIVDEETGFWGQIAVGAIRFVDVPTVTLGDRPDVGDMALALLDGEGRVAHGVREPFDPGTGEAHATTPARPRSALVRTLTLAPGESTTVTFAIAWRFPNLSLAGLGRVGNHYATRFQSAGEVVDHLVRNRERLEGTTRLWRDTWYDSTLPRWLLDRAMVGAGVLASATCYRFADGRFYGWEGVGGCEGTCGHVWAYAQSAARLFPSLERNRREAVDYGLCWDERTGIIPFRSEFGFGYAADAQAGYVLRTLREHQMSPDDGFLRRVYPRMRKALEFLIGQDGDGNGVLEGRQHNTLDVDLYGPSSWLTSYYLAALRAGEEMARETGDAAFADRCRAIFDRGAGGFDATFWNGEYFVHRIPKDAPPDSMRIGDGCHIDALMGQWYAHQLGLGRIVGRDRTRQSLKAVVRHNLVRDVGPYRERYKPGRWYAMPGEPGTIMCTFPKNDRAEVFGPKPTWATMYFNECWTGQEHQLAAHLIHEGLAKEGLAVVRAVHDRHHPRLRNPYNEVEYSDHYARSMASHGVFLAACGYEHHGPKGHLGFAPRVGRERFRAAFTAAEGWGSYRQHVEGKSFEAGIALRRGRLRLATLALETAARGKVRVTMGGREVAATARREGDRLTLAFAPEVGLGEGDELLVRVEA